MRTIEITAKTTEKAIEDGLKQLNAKIEDVEIKIISEGGLFKKAKVEITLTEEPEQKTEVKKRTIKDFEDLNEELTLNVKELFKTVKEDVPQAPKKEESAAVKKEDKSQKAAKEAKKQEKTAVVKAEDKETKTADKTERVKEKVSLTEVKKAAEDFLKGFIYTFNINAEAVVEIENGDVTAKINGENLGSLIGYHGEGLDAIQFILNTVVANKTSYRGRIYLDIENYREKRKQNLISLAERLSQRVLETKRSYKLDAMNSFERRVIHSYLQGKENLTTHSEGMEPNRRLVIDYKE